MMFSQNFNTHRIFKRLAKALIRPSVSAALSESMLVAHTTLLGILCCGSSVVMLKLIACCILYRAFIAAYFFVLLLLSAGFFFQNQRFPKVLSGISSRALTRILKTGVPEPSLPKSGSLTIQKNIASFKK